MEDLKCRPNKVKYYRKICPSPLDLLLIWLCTGLYSGYSQKKVFSPPRSGSGTACFSIFRVVYQIIALCLGMHACTSACMRLEKLRSSEKVKSQVCDIFCDYRQLFSCTTPVVFTNNMCSKVSALEQFVVYCFCSDQ